MTIPSGNGEMRGPESADGMGTPLAGTRPERAARNCRANPILDGPPVMAQDGMGKEDMECSPSWMGTSDMHAADYWGQPPHLMDMGDGGEPFGGS